MGGAVRLTGGTSEQKAIARAALHVTSEVARAHVHGFHSYPARLHPQTAARLIEGFSPPGATLLDPFCGSGTSLVEARRLGRPSVGSDLNPLALELSWLKTLAPNDATLTRLVASAEQVAEYAHERRIAKAGPLRRYPKTTLKSFPPHVLLELDSLLSGVRALGDAVTRRALLLVISSLLTKVSTDRSDTSKRAVQPRLRAGFAAEFFQRKAGELSRRLRRYSRLTPADSALPELYQRDARQLSVLKSESVALIVCSPPYPGIFDYLEHHRLRLGLLELSAEPLQAREIGARRRYAKLSFEQAVARWRAEFGDCLREMARLLEPGGFAALIIGDSAVGGQALRADEELREWAPQAALRFVMCASQTRPSFHRQSDRAFGRRPRSEHLVLLQKSAQGSSRSRSSSSST